MSTFHNFRKLLLFLEGEIVSGNTHTTCLHYPPQKYPTTTINYVRFSRPRLSLMQYALRPYLVIIPRVTPRQLTSRFHHGHEGEEIPPPPPNTGHRRGHAGRTGSESKFHQKFSGRNSPPFCSGDLIKRRHCSAIPSRYVESEGN